MTWSISIHALREEGDALTPLSTSPGIYFYPRPPRGGRPDETVETYQYDQISIHALREEGDKLRSATLSSRSLFLSTPSARRATKIE